MDESVSKMGFAGAGWLTENIKYEKQKRTISDFGLQVANLLGDLYLGIYHIDTKSLHKVDWEDTRRIALVVYDHGQFGTFDFDQLTRLVFLAHDYNIKASIQSASPRHIRLVFYRITPGFSFREDHPTLEESVSNHRKYYLPRNKKDK